MNTVQLPAVGDLPSENLVLAYNDVGLQTELTQRVLGNRNWCSSVLAVR